MEELTSYYKTIKAPLQLLLKEDKKDKPIGPVMLESILKSDQFKKELVGFEKLLEIRFAEKFVNFKYVSTLVERTEFESIKNMLHSSTATNTIRIAGLEENSQEQYKEIN